MCVCAFIPKLDLDVFKSFNLDDSLRNHRLRPRVFQAVEVRVLDVWRHPVEEDRKAISSVELRLAPACS